MLIAKWEKIDSKRLIYQLKDEPKQLLVYNNITNIWVIMTAKELCRAFVRNIVDGLFDVYELRYVGKEICTDDVDLQEELDMIDDGIFNYGEK